jgi:hypothetical protein
VIHHAAVLANGTNHIGTAIAHCEACGYQLYGIVQDWKAAYDLLQAGLVSVIVVAARDVWAPTIEYAERTSTPTITAGGSPNARWRERRARMMRR